MKRAGLVLGVLAVLVIALVGCDVLRPSAVSSKSTDGTLTAMIQAREDGTGWVNVTVSGIQPGDYRLHFGDSYEDWSYMEISSNGVYGHFYARPGAYAVSVLPFHGGTPLAQGVAEVHTCSYHLALQDSDGRDVTFVVYGVQGGDQEGLYQLSFGDGNGLTIFGKDSTPIIVNHSYPYAGSYTAVLQPGLAIGSKADLRANQELILTVSGASN